MNTLTKTSLCILPSAAALAVALSTTTPASAGTHNGLSMNGIRYNGLSMNGSTFNALVAQVRGAAFDFDAGRVTGVTLPAAAE